MHLPAKISNSSVDWVKPRPFMEYVTMAVASGLSNCTYQAVFNKKYNYYCNAAELANQKRHKQTKDANSLTVVVDRVLFKEFGEVPGNEIVLKDFTRMPENTLTSCGPIDIFTKRKRSRCDSTSSLSSNSPPIQRTLELNGVIEVLKEYESIEGNDINCCMCGKSYKGKVCFTKHLWEHSIYWETFDGVKNQERVLSIQAAIILSNPFLEFLLVTSPSSQDKKKEDINKSSHNSKQQSKKKRKRPYMGFSNVQE